MCYAIRESLAGQPITDYEAVVDLENWSGRPPEVHETAPDGDVNARLYLVTSQPDEPEWAGFLRAGFGSQLRVRGGLAPGALLLVRVETTDGTRFVAFSFGSGRFLLRSGTYHRRFGLRVALNLIFEGDAAGVLVDASRLRSVDTKRVSANPVRMRHQTSRKAALEAFDVDRDRDFLGGVTGVPADTASWGTNVTGSDSLTTNVDVSFAELPAFCTRLLEAEAQPTYKVRFGWIDDVRVVTEEETVRTLEHAVLDRLHARSADDLDLALPEVVDWSRIRKFTLPHERSGKHPVTRPELRLADYLSAVSSRGRLTALSVDTMKTQRIDALDGNDETIYRWNPWRCLSGEIELDGKSYVIDDGAFYEVNPDYLAELNRVLGAAVPQSALTLPDASVRWIEDDYNKHVAQTAGLLLMDKRTVRVSSSTSPIEVCDLLSPAKQFVHVKRKLGSSLLSHLFAQGLVSAELLQESADFRREASAMAAQVAGEAIARAAHTKASGFTFLANPVPPADVEVVFAIIADWRGKILADRLPFFSKVNLRRCAKDLELRGYRVTHVPVQTKL